ncbi:hypothetical protein G9A89_009163 [Geosiphon pyriformis]|nr:hypothetical protein G9A89_009163 [Geosiphon pyriformis]
MPNQIEQLEMPRSKMLLQDLEIAAKYASLAYCLSLESIASRRGNIYADAKLQISDDQRTKYIILYIKGKFMDYYSWITRKPFLYPFRTVLGSKPDYPEKFHAFRNSRVDQEFFLEFNHAFLAIRQKVIKAAGENINSIKLMKIVGHDLGGVYSVIASIYFKAWMKNLIIEVISFGLPIIGDKEFVRALRSQPGVFYFRVIYYNDYVPRISNLPTGEHDPEQIWIEPGNCDCGSEDRVFWCFQGTQSEEYQDSQYCSNQFSQDNLQNGISSHDGPYFGYLMNSCTSQVLQLSS